MLRGKKGTSAITEASGDLLTDGFTGEEGPTQGLEEGKALAWGRKRERPLREGSSNGSPEASGKDGKQNGLSGESHVSGEKQGLRAACNGWTVVTPTCRKPEPVVFPE